MCGIVLSTLLILTIDGIPLGLAPISSPAETSAFDARATPGHATPARLAKSRTDGPGQSSGSQSPVAELATAASQRTGVSFGAVVSGIWLALAAVMLTRMAVSAARAHRIVHQSQRVESRRVIDALGAARRRIGLNATHSVQLRQTGELSVPFTIGIFRPAIVIPSAANQWSPAKLEMVLAHELAHVLRRDVLCHWLNRLSCCVAGFNPLTWLAQRHCIFERERACDDRVLAAGYSATDYGQSLLEVAAAVSGRTSLPAVGVSMAYPQLRRRLEKVLASEVDRRPLSNRLVWPLLALFVAVTVVGGALRPFDARLVADEQPARVVVEPTKSTPVPKADGNVGPVRGTVTDADGKPIAGATVVVQLAVVVQLGNPTIETPIRDWSTQTDEHGVFQVDAGPVDALPAGAQIQRHPGFGRWLCHRHWSMVARQGTARGRRRPPANNPQEREKGRRPGR